jgi:predicted transcriptional regulator
MSRSEVFLAQVEAFLERTGMTPTAFGKAALNDPNFIRDLRQGRKPNLDLVEHIQEFMAQFDRAALFEGEVPK